MSDASREQLGSPERFGHSWDIFSEILPIHEEQFLRWTTGLKKEEWSGKQFLDVGCGIGRNSYWPLTYGAAGCLSIDIDERTLALQIEDVTDESRSAQLQLKFDW